MTSNVKVVSVKTFVWTTILILILASFTFIILITNSKSDIIQSNIHVLQNGNDNYKRIYVVNTGYFRVVYLVLTSAGERLMGLAA